VIRPTFLDGATQGSNGLPHLEPETFLINGFSTSASGDIIVATKPVRLGAVSASTSMPCGLAQMNHHLTISAYAAAFW